MKYKSEANSFIFIASIAIGILISMNISLKKVNIRPFLSAKQYQEAYNEKTKLYSQVTNLLEQYNKYSDKLKGYKEDNENEKKIMEEIKKEMLENELEMGTVEVEGQGIKITLKDAQGDILKEGNYYEKRLRLIHDSDMIQVINDLRNAGAEAISINGQRVTNKSEVYCNGPFLSVNGVKIVSPFYVNAIGNKTSLKEYMLRNDNYLQSLILRKIYVKLEEADNINIPSYSGEFKRNFIKEVKK
ncbi:DUF881 domain-containing protein [Clostridium niameyense]|uniref:DUF881 domain-containing protein n=1 Tax=Clostridium niameyense TaxID=1622073 RepID=A0A6M0RAW5_9CLOT|nr:DUF881 domain-containing protein [Clostridium niameyense]NEZ46368.1 DUF881 domain-containing protein [Clostridium niameyense]